MKVGFIARGLTNGGVTRYIENVLRVLDLDYSHENTLILFTDQKDYKGIFKNIQVVYIKKGNKIFWDYIKIIPFLLKVNLDVAFYPKNIIPVTHLFFKFKKINIIHDLAYFSKELNEYKYFDTIYTKLFIKLSCAISSLVVADSYSTKQDIEKKLKVTPAKIKVVYLAAENKFKQIVDEKLIIPTLLKHNINRPFFFYCGSLSPRKNILRVLMAFNEIKDDISHNLYLSGGQSWRDSEVKEYILNNLADRVFLTGRVSDDDLICLYSSADLFLYPSLFEGFGLPILEAQACGCPVMTSNRTSCAEVAGAGAVIVDPYDIEEIKIGILKVLADRFFREEIVRNGFLNVQKYSWSKTAENLLKCAQSICEK